MYKKKELVMGFGHRVYKNGDPRNKIIKNCSKMLSETSFGSPKLYEISERIDSIMLKEKKIKFCVRYNLSLMKDWLCLLLLFLFGSGLLKVSLDPLCKY